jgi:uncharacterized repeat protein (TIGR01451 family)/LPXTG-motif cell wall-anchored protein
MSKGKFVIFGILAAVIGFVGFGLSQGDAANAESRECGDNSIIRCGAMSASELKSEYAKNERGLKAIYSHYNIDASDIAASSSAKTGYVLPNGDVTVGGKVVATNAYTVGRSASLGGSKVTINSSLSVYEGANRLKSKLSAYVFFNKDGTFKSAVLKVCGNPVRATPKKPTPKPVYTCDSLAAKKISRNEYQFTTEATAKNGAKIVKYTYDFGDGKTSDGDATIRHTFASAGTYTIIAKVSVLVDGKTVTASGTCKTTITIEKENCPIPGKENYPKDSPECKEDKPAISITKTVNDVEHVKVKVGTTFTYQITVKNTGDVALKDAVVTDTAPSEVALVSASLGEISGNTWTYTIPTLAVGESKSYTITAKYATYADGTHVNNVCVDTPTVPGGPDDCDTASTETYKEETPAELPHTGIGDNIGAILGAGSVVGVGAAYLASRRSLR